MIAESAKGTKSAESAKSPKKAKNAVGPKAAKTTQSAMGFERAKNAKVTQ